MKHLLLSFSLLAVMFFSANAQKQEQKYKVSLGGEVLYPLGNTGEFYSIGYGGSLQGEYLVSPKLSITASGGYTTLSISQRYKDIFAPWGVTPKNTVVYPVKAGLKYDFYKKIYVAAEAGAAISQPNAVRATSFAYAGGVGTNFDISSRSSLNLSLRYEAWSLNTNDTYSFAGLRAAYVFGF